MSDFHDLAIVFAVIAAAIVVYCVVVVLTVTGDLVWHRKEYREEEA